MKVIDFARKGNVIRLYLGHYSDEWGWINPDYRIDNKRPVWLKPSKKYYGDDWNDAPYEDNAGTIYDQFIFSTYDIFVPYDYEVLEPIDMNISKEDMANRKLPCLIITKKNYIDFAEALTDSNSFKIYFGDDLNRIFEMSALHIGDLKQ